MRLKCIYVRLVRQYYVTVSSRIALSDNREYKLNTQIKMSEENFNMSFACIILYFVKKFHQIFAIKFFSVYIILIKNIYTYSNIVLKCYINLHRYTHVFATRLLLEFVYNSDIYTMCHNYTWNKIREG